MLIDKNLTWKYHINYIASKISGVVGIILRLRHSVPLNTLIQVYRSLIFLYTHYGIAAWGQAAQVYLRKVFILQKRALRLMFFAGNRSHAIPLFVSANVLPLHMLYFETVCSLMHDISTSFAPQNICDLFTCSSDLHTYNTRFSVAGNLYINKSRLRIQLNSFSIFGANLLNCLKPDLRKLRKQPFIGETGRRLGDRFREHLRDVEKDDKNASKPVARHFNLPNHSKQHMVVCGLSLTSRKHWKP